MLEWATRDEIDAPLGEVERAVLDSSLLPEIVARAPMIAEASLVERIEGEHRIVRRVRMRSAITPPLFLRVVEGDHLEWIEEVAWDRVAHTGRVTITPNLRPERRHLLRCEGTYALMPRGERTEREVCITIDVGMRIVGPLVERLVASQLGPQLDAELAALRARTERKQSAA